LKHLSNRRHADLPERHALIPVVARDGQALDSGRSVDQSAHALLGS
jgi:hypothetical protein